MDVTNYPYRRAVLGIIIDDQSRFLLVQKVNYKSNEWSFAGGGIERDEDSQQSLKRELAEELGINDFDIKSVTKKPSRYEWPEEAILRRHQKDGRWYRGQEVITYLVKPSNPETSLSIQKEEIRTTKWVTYNQLPKHLVFPNQWPTIQKVLQEFGITA